MMPVIARCAMRSKSTQTGSRWMVGRCLIVKETGSCVMKLQMEETNIGEEKENQIPKEGLVKEPEGEKKQGRIHRYRSRVWVGRGSDKALGQER